MEHQVAEKNLRNIQKQQAIDKYESLAKTFQYLYIEGLLWLMIEFKCGGYCFVEKFNTWTKSPVCVIPNLPNITLGVCYHNLDNHFLQQLTNFGGKCCEFEILIMHYVSILALYLTSNKLV